MNISQRLAALRTEMDKRNLDAYIIPTDDFHGSEYVGSYFKAREYMSGFTGSAGTLVVCRNRALLWTDGRYFLQAADQLKDSTIELMKMREPGVPDLPDFLEQELPEKARIGFDARVITATFAAQLKKAAAGKNMTFCGNEDLVDLIWPDRPALSRKKVWKLSDDIAGLSRSKKLSMVRDAMREKKMDILAVAALDEIAWLLNLRGDDIACTPVFLSYMIIEEKKAWLFAAEEIFSEEIAAELSEDGISLCPYENVYSCLEKEAQNKKVWADANAVNERLMECMEKAEEIFSAPSPIELMKAVKTPQEMAGMVRAHVRDGVAVTRFIYWLQTHVGRERITELSAAAKLLEFRKEQEGFLGESFDPILAFGAHGAIVHYEPTPETDVEMEPRSFCLADTGGHYVDGTTDITRTIPLGKLTEEEKTAYTLVLKGHLALADAHFISGVSGQNLDYLAREPLWEHGMDYNHGTGHGVGFIMSVHEGPHRIHWGYGSQKPVALQEGMIVSDEPGLYLTGKFGIRHENLVLCQKDQKTDFGQFLKFRSLTMVPFDKNAIDFSLFHDLDYKRLNAYHAEVWKAIEPYFEGEERAWLREATSPVKSES